MSASSKKKLRKEQNAAALTEKQLAAQKEAKKLKLLTTAFVVVMAAILVVAITVGVNQTLTNSGYREKHTIALTVGEHEINSVQMNYFYIDAVESFYNNYGSYASMFGLDLSRPLNEQVLSAESGLTWADDFLTSAKSTAQAVYALVDAAKAEGYTLSEDEMTNITFTMQNIESYAMIYGYEDGDAFLRSKYGYGSDMDSYREYTEMCALADSYQQHYAASLTYEDADRRAVDGENFQNYTSYSFNTYYLATSKFLTGGTADDTGAITYTEEEKAAALTAAEAAAQELSAEGINTVEAFDAAIAGLSVNEGLTAASTDYTGTLYTALSATYSQWLTDESRVEGDIAYFPSTSTDAEGKETVNGYYIVLFRGVDDNTDPMINVRHILVSPEGGTVDPTTGMTTYSDEEMAAAKTTAEELYAQWQSGDATEDSFAAMAMEKSSDPGSASNGGLIENVYPGQMVVNFNNWCFDESRMPGDSGIVESSYGYHIMYFVGDSDLSYRDFLIDNELREADVAAWFDAMMETAPITEGDTKYIHLDMTLGG